jgi:hypothetical protein
MFSLLGSIVSGVVVYIVGQFLLKAVVEPAIDLKKTIGRIAGDLDLYANKLRDEGADGDKARLVLREHACDLRSKLNAVLWYQQSSTFLQMPPEADVFTATAYLMGQSNPQPGISYEHIIKKLLRIRPRAENGL